MNNRNVPIDNWGNVVDSVRVRTDLNFKKNTRSIIAGLLAVLFLLSIVRVGWIVFVKGDEYRSSAQQSQLHDTEIKAMRGSIYDCNMSPIVTSSSAWIFCCDPSLIYGYFKKKADGSSFADSYRSGFKKYTKYLGSNMAKILDLKKQDVIDILRDKTSGYARIKKKVDAAQKLKLDALLKEEYCFAKVIYEGEEIKLTVQGKDFFSYENDNLRLYPENNFASTLIGVTNSEGSGITGVEMYYNSTLSGSSGRVLTAQDSKGRALESSYETVFDAHQGNGLVLTIDKKIQHTLENALSHALDSTGAKGVYGIVMDVDTGKILAMSDKPDFDLNNPYELLDKSAVEELKKYKKKNKEESSAKETELLYDQWNSFCVTSTYEPGSTFKIFTAAAALEEGVADLNTGYTCYGSYRVSNDTTIHCANTAGHGYQTFTQGLMNSCNPFFIDIGQKMGVDTFYKYFEAFGFTERTGIDLTGEAYPIYHSHDNMGIVELASTSFGQSFRVSPIQMITAGCAIANGGKLMTPYVVDSIVDSQGNIISKNEPRVKRQVVSEGTAATVRKMMEAVVEGGTGKNAYIEGYRVAGKTATSEKLDAVGGAIGNLKYVASFLCFAPADDPQVAILVGVDEPPGEYRGGGVLAAPIAKEVMEDTLKYLNVEPQYTAEELQNIGKTTPSLVGRSTDDARVVASNEGLSVRIVGNGSIVVSQVPTEGQTIPENGVIVAYTDNKAEAEKVKVPDFTGMSASLVNQTATYYGINATLSGPAGSAGARAYKQDIEAGTEIQAGSSVVVYFQATANMDD